MCVWAYSPLPEGVSLGPCIHILAIPTSLIVPRSRSLQMIGMEAAYVTEYSEVDPVAKRLTMRSRNVRPPTLVHTALPSRSL